MTCPLTDNELNAWCAELCGVDITSELRIKASDNNYLRGWPAWVAFLPCTDRNQAQLVVEKMAKMQPNRFVYYLGEMLQEPRPFQFIGGVMLEALHFTPRQICEAAWEAMQ